MNGWRGDPAEIVCASVSSPGEMLRMLVPPPPAWHSLARCRDHPTDLWFPVLGEDGAVAKSICAGCLVRAECLAEAVADPSLDHGIRGGAAPRDRRKLRRAALIDAGPGDGGRVESSRRPPGQQHPAHADLSDSENESHSGPARESSIRSHEVEPAPRSGAVVLARGAPVEIVEEIAQEGLA